MYVKLKKNMYHAKIMYAKHKYMYEKQRIKYEKQTNKKNIQYI